MILDKMPSAEEFYKTYWGQKPFVVRGAIDSALIDNMIDGDELAGLSLEEDIKSRLVVSDGDKLKCYHGPLDENKFSTIGDEGWSLLVQNVDQYHADTAKLLRHFSFAPLWLMDDIMVSYSAAGGGVGPHTDSYHVFLTQGKGIRKWKISEAPICDENFIEGMDLKVLKNGFDGTEIEVSKGDVIYIPPHFGHEGVTLEEAMTFSVGFLCPKLSEMLVEYGSYLEEDEDRYCGQGLEASSASYSIDIKAQMSMQDNLIDLIKSDDFSVWLAKYFSTPTHDEIDNIEAREETISSADLLARLQSGDSLYRPEYIRFSITKSEQGITTLSVYGKVIPTMTAEHERFINWLNENTEISMQNIYDLGDQTAIIALVTNLYNQNILFFAS